MAYKKKNTDGRKNNRPPQHTQFGQPGANKPYRRGKQKKSTTVDEDINAAFASLVHLTIDGERVTKTKRQIILEQIINQAAKGDPVFVRIAISLMRSTDDSPDFEPLPEDLEVLKRFQQTITHTKEANDDSQK